MKISDLPDSLTERIFTKIRNEDRKEVAKVSKNWFTLCLGTVIAICVDDILWLEDLTDFLNHIFNKQYNWFSLFGTLTKLTELDSCFYPEDYFEKVDQIIANDPNALFNLSKLCWAEPIESQGSAIQILKNAPLLTDLVLRLHVLGQDWIGNIPETVTRLELQIEDFDQDMATNFCLSLICPSVGGIQILRLTELPYLPAKLFSDFHNLPNLKKFALTSEADGSEITALMVHVFKRCKQLSSFHVTGAQLDNAWESVIPPSVSWVKLTKPIVFPEDASNFSFRYMFSDIATLKTLIINEYTFKGCEIQLFEPIVSLRKLAITIEDRSSIADPYHYISFQMMQSQLLTSVKLSVVYIQAAWQKIFPRTLLRLDLNEVFLDDDILDSFNVAYMLSEPRKLKFLAMFVVQQLGASINKNFFRKMSGLETVRFGYKLITHKCVESLLTECTSLVNLSLIGLEAYELFQVSVGVQRPSVKELELAMDIVSPNPIFLHFPNVNRLHMILVSQPKILQDFTFHWPFLEILEIHFKHLPDSVYLDSLLLKTESSGFRYVYVTAENENRHVFHLSDRLSWVSCELYFDYFNNREMKYASGFHTSLTEDESDFPADKSGLLANFKNFMSKLFKGNSSHQTESK